MKQNEIDYLNALAQAKLMLSQEIITKDDFDKIEQLLANKYSLNSLSLIRPNKLINDQVRAIYMIQNKGGQSDGNSNSN